MQINPAEISELIKSKIQNLPAAAEKRSEGSVISVTDGICRVHGLADVMQGEMLEFPNNTFGLALNLERDSVGSVILGDYQHIKEGDTVKCTGRILEVPVGPELLGRVVNSLGAPIDGKGPINAKMTDVIEKVAPGVIARKSVDQPVQTGLKAIDAMVPIGRGPIDISVQDSIKRDFEHLAINFGCTGGQHRSVYAAEAVARHLRNKFKVKIELNHQNKKNWKVL